MSNYQQSGPCEICGEHRGGIYDHSECSKLKQEMHKKDKRSRHRAKLGEKQIDYLVKRADY